MTLTWAAVDIHASAADVAATPSAPSFQLKWQTGVHSWQGRAVAITPFDLKLMGSGFYEFAEPQNAVASPKTLEQIFDEAAAFQYKTDGADEWQNPDVTEQLRRGDCEDMAVWLFRELRKNGFAGVRIMVGKFEQGEARFHTWAVCLGADGEDWIVDPALQRQLWKRSELLTDMYVPAYSFDGQFKYAHFSE